MDQSRDWTGKIASEISRNLSNPTQMRDSIIGHPSLTDCGGKGRHCSVTHDDVVDEEEHVEMLLRQVIMLAALLTVSVF